MAISKASIINREEVEEARAKLDAWVSSIRGLARIHRCAHTLTFSQAVKLARPLHLSLHHANQAAIASMRSCIEAGIPEEELVAIRTLLFG